MERFIERHAGEPIYHDDHPGRGFSYGASRSPVVRGYFETLDECRADLSAALASARGKGEA